jgi:hypothetical protein
MEGQTGKLFQWQGSKFVKRTEPATTKGDTISEQLAPIRELALSLGSPRVQPCRIIVTKYHSNAVTKTSIMQAITEAVVQFDSSNSCTADNGKDRPSLLQQGHQPIPVITATGVLEVKEASLLTHPTSTVHDDAHGSPTRGAIAPANGSE